MLILIIALGGFSLEKTQSLAALRKPELMHSLHSSSVLISWICSGDVCSSAVSSGHEKWWKYLWSRALSEILVWEKSQNWHFYQRCKNNSHLVVAFPSNTSKVICAQLAKLWQQPQWCPGSSSPIFWINHVQALLCFVAAGVSSVCRNQSTLSWWSCCFSQLWHLSGNLWMPQRKCSLF